VSPADPPSLLRQTGWVALDFGAVSGHPRRPPILVEAISLMLIKVDPCPEEVWAVTSGSHVRSGPGEAGSPTNNIVRSI
jgi:hypothetical protein